MRGFHLYTALAGSLIVAIVVAYSIYLTSLENSHVNRALELQKKSQYIPYIDIMKEESFATTSTVFRTVFQRYIESTYLSVPKEVYESGNFGEWVREHLLESRTARNRFALYLMSELRSYISVQSPGTTITIEGSTEGLKRAVAEGVEVIPREDSVFIIIDPSQMDRETLESLPRMKVCKGGYCKTVSIFPTERTEVTVPLRLLLAFEKAREAYEQVEREEGHLWITAGFCKGGCALCGVFEFRGSGVDRLYPEGEDLDCDKVVVPLESFVDESGYYRATGMHNGGCANLSLYWEELNKYIPCSSPEEILKLYYNEKVRELSQDLEGNLELLTNFIDKVPTMYMDYEEVVDVGMLLSSSVIPPEVLRYLGIDIHSEDQIMRLPGKGCKGIGYAYCAYPKRLVFLYSWTDEDNRYSVGGYPVTYHFLIDLGENNDLEDYLLYLSDKARNLSTLSEELETDVAGCEQRLNELCQPDVLREVLSSVCNFSSDTLESMVQELNNQSDECKAAASPFIGDSGACWDVEGACRRGVDFRSREELADCASKTLSGCWKTLSDLTKDGGPCSEDIGTLTSVVCSLGTAFDVFTGSFLARKVISSLPHGTEGTDILLNAWSRTSPGDICRANHLMEAFYSDINQLSEGCREELNAILNNSLSPCTNPMGVCVTTSSLSVSEPTSELCQARSIAKLRSTFHYNIFDPSYMEVGCYAGN